jgi:predicted Na+-dependent transporter
MQIIFLVLSGFVIAMLIIILVQFILFPLIGFILGFIFMWVLEFVLFIGELIKKAVK